MILWDYELRRANASARLNSLSAPRMLSFSTAALAHAIHARLSGVDAGVGRIVSTTLDLAWARIAGAERTDVEPLLTDLRRLMPEEDAPGAPGVADSLDGAARLCSLADLPTAKGALTIASYAYQALTCWVLDPSSTMGAEERFVEAERASAECLAEIAFQLAYLAALERLDVSVAPSWDCVIALL